MSKYKSFSFVIAIVLAGFMVQTSNAQTTYAVPAKVRLEASVRKAFPDYRPRGDFPQLIPQQFFPIGWSRDGKFAYYTEPVDEACGCYFAQLVIQDMRTDKVLWEYKYNQDDGTDANGKMPPEDNIRKLWRKNAKLFSSKLREHRIQAGRSILLAPTFTSGGTYTAKALVTMGKNQDEDERVSKLAFTLTSKGSGTKTLSSIDHTKDEYMNLLGANVIGVIKSPFEPRVAVIGIEINRGWEGPPHNGDVVIVGASLTSGFTNK